MDCETSNREYQEYRVVMILPWSLRLIGIRNGGSIRLPRVRLAKGKRQATELTRVLENEWKVEAMMIDALPSQSGACPCVVVECRTQSWDHVRQSFCLLHPHEIDNAELDSKEQEILHAILSGSACQDEPFLRLGWMTEAQNWIASSVQDHAVLFDENIQQLNASGTFALVRFSTQHGPSYWLKATGFPNLHEFEITMALVKEFPEYLPTVVAARRDWNAWVMEDSGFTLSEVATLPALKRAITCLAELQKKSLTRTSALLTAGCLNRPVEGLEANVDELMSYIGEAMQQQSSTKVPRLEKRRIRELGDLLHHACSAMRDLSIPDSLGHYDMNLGNILTNGSRCVFTDWAEAFIGPPFLTFQYLWIQIERRSEELRARRSELQLIYKEQWLEFLSASQIECALALTPLLAIAFYLYGRGTWLDSPQRENPVFQSYARGLARHMDRAARHRDLMEALCA